MKQNKSTVAAVLLLTIAFLYHTVTHDRTDVLAQARTSWNTSRTLVEALPQHVVHHVEE